MAVVGQHITPGRKAEMLRRLAAGEVPSRVAADMGITRGTVYRHARDLRTGSASLKRDAERGAFGFGPVLPGYAIKETSTQMDADGNVEREWVRQAKERGEPFALPAGHVVKGYSALVDAEGRTIQQWIKTREDQAAVDLRAALEAAFSSHAGYAALPPAPAYTDDDLLTVYPIVDLHLGLFAWGRETGADYDLKIAADLLRRSMSTLVARSADSRHAIVLDLGDYFHADNSRNQTARSGNPLDVDTRYAKVLQVGVELAIECIELALQKHERVTYRKLPGNHDDETSLMLAIALAAWFRNEPRVTVDTDPSRFFVHRHGRCLVAATHGDMLKMGDMAGYMAAAWPREWGETEHRYAYTGHVHHDRVKAANGVRAESFNTLAAKDAWHAGSGYTAARSAVSITLHREHGEIDRLTVALPREFAAAAA